MRKLLAGAAGLAIGIFVASRLARAVRTYSPTGLAAAGRDSGLGLLGTVKDFITDVREGMAEREAEIHAAFVEGVALDDELHYPSSEEDEPTRTPSSGAAHR